MSPLIIALFISALGLGTTVTFASSHWLLAWMGLEMNTMAILPLMSARHHPRAVEACTKYFLTQSAAAATLLFAGTTNAWLTGQWDIQVQMHPVSATLIILAIALKLGLAPLHTWLPEVLQGLDLITGLIMSTWQKLAPLALLIQSPLHDHPLLMALGLASTLVGGWGGLNQTQLRKVLAYSSIAHLGWMLLVSQFAPQLTVLALFLYVFMTTALFTTLNLSYATNLNSLSSSSTQTPALTALAPLVLLSLGGLPPLSGFLPKWMILAELTKQDLGLMATLAALSALLSLYFYLRLCYAMTLTISPNTLSSTTLWRFVSPRFSVPLAAAACFSIMSLPLGPTLYSLVV
uniref:NADH-ubiquinone oxidoreductase chain 2 n=1 Tax=Schindleria sp. TG-2010-2 TaxID=764838 RepID=D5MU67_9GOBI|nr:NADH dehydrogenase subunit 2 [Schindleria sp. TG-2010-2]